MDNFHSRTSGPFRGIQEQLIRRRRRETWKSLEADFVRHEMGETLCSVCFTVFGRPVRPKWRPHLFALATYVTNGLGYSVHLRSFSLFANQIADKHSPCALSVYCASGSGRSWKCKTLVVVPLPPSAWKGVRVPYVAQIPLPFQPAFRSSIRPSIPFA